MSKYFFIMCLIVVIMFSCSDRKTKKIVIGFSGDYSDTFEGGLTRKIIANFLKKNDLKEYEFRAMKKGSLAAALKSGKIDIALDDFEMYPSGEIRNIPASENLFSGAVYFIMGEDESRAFKYPDSVNIMNTGIMYKSGTFTSLKKSFPGINTGIGSKLHYYKDVGNLLRDFGQKKIDIAVLSRMEFYRHLAVLPDTYLYFLEDENYYGKILFSKKSLGVLFNSYLSKRKNHKHDWSDILGEITVTPLL